MMLLKTAMLAALLGVTGCATIPATDAGICRALEYETRNTREALLDSGGSDAVGEAATDLLIGLYAACDY